MKIAIIGYSGAGKSTLARELGKRCGCEVLHLDRVHFAPGWGERSNDEMAEDVARFLTRESWVIEGNYSRVLPERRFGDADQILFLDLPPLVCLRRVFRRYRTYRGTSRPDMREGCEEKLDGEFIRWILWDGRTQAKKAWYRSIREQYGEKVTTLRSQREIDAFLEKVPAGDIRWETKGI